VVLIMAAPPHHHQGLQGACSAGDNVFFGLWGVTAVELGLVA
jgi:hypothetical protein